MATKVTHEDIVKMNELYLEIKTYAGVARVVGFSPTTVKKYIDPNFVPVSKIEKYIFSAEILDISAIEYPSSSEDWSKLLSLSEEEKILCDELRKEILI